MATALIDQWIATNGPLPALTFATGNIADNAQAMTSQAFRFRCLMAATAAAIAISSELGTTPDHINRATLAKAFLNAPQTYAVVFSQALASQGLDETSNDIAIANGISSVWNAVAG